jgi:hypothetical protein
MTIEVAGGSEVLHNEELHNLHASPNILGWMRWTRHVARKGKMRNAYKILVGKPEQKRTRRRWGDNIIMDL